MKYRVNTPQPSFTVEADNLDQATSMAVGRGLPVRFERGDVVTSKDVAKEGQTFRYVHLFRRRRDGSYHEKPYTGFVIYKEP